MIKSLYVRLILMFIASVLASVVLSFFMTHFLFSYKLRTYVQDNLIASGKTIIESYKHSYPNNLDALMEGITALPIFTFIVYDEQGRPLHETDKVAKHKLNVEGESLRSVLSGGVYRGGMDKDYDRLVVGLPFQMEGHAYALFIKPETNGVANLAVGYFRMQLIFVLLIGTLLVIVTSRYMVRPLKHLTLATRKMAKGDFSIRLATKRKDEIGELTASFNQMAQELDSLERVRRQFVSDVSHEIQSPLTSIKGFTMALKQKKMDEESRLRLLTIIEEESDRLSRLTQDLLKLSALEQDQIQPNMSQYRLDEQLKDVMIASEPLWSVKNIQLDLDLEPVVITADEDKLSQLWTNLLSNAIKFTGAGGVISIQLAASQHSVTVAVADSGAGIPEEELHHIFKPFYKIDQARERAVGGNGIGLSIVKRIVELHAGEVRAESALGKGTTMTVVLPLAPPDKSN
ncbi:HAMP domain-containing sensor histidine kinase [Paenibacillus algorifonticola]|uniref:sensor histidine kinase n=1 Tax=Paenibacillus algorifonticola TaxID=684063 RepID=UPI003D2999B8